MDAILIGLVLTLLVAIGLLFLHLVQPNPGNYWEHLEWVCVGLFVGLFASGHQVESIVPLAAHLLMGIISKGVMWFFGYKAELKD